MSSVPDNAPQHCPGTGSEDAGKASACAGCPNQNLCATGAAAGPDPAIEIIKERLSKVKHKILILSGKGGVGKSTVTSLLGHGLAARNPDINVGILDADICGPSQPRVLGVRGEQVHNSGSGWSPVYVSDNLSLMSIGFLLGSPDDAVIWRGPKKNGMIKQFLSEVDWGDLDYLLIDTPPGTSDEHLSAVQYLSGAGLSGAVVVTTPQETALLDVRKELQFCQKLGARVLGVVENMSLFVCPNCKTRSEIFPATTGGAAQMCLDLSVPLLGSLPLDPVLARCCDDGRDFLQELPHSPAVVQLTQILDNGATSPSCPRVSDIIKAEKMLLLRAQVDSFPEEWKTLSASQPVSKNSRISALAPILCDDGLIRLHSRITSTPGIHEEVKAPIILDGRHHITRLLIHDQHLKAAHAFNELVLNELRQKYWILRARDSIRSVAKTCQQCLRWRGQPITPQMGNLPLERLDHHKRPFTHVGLDYFGPVAIKIYRRQEKRYVALYTCLVSRAVHLEMVASLSSDAAIMSLRRFIARRGSPSTIFSDNGTCFVGACRELRNLHDESVVEYATNHRIQWRFIPPASPFMGGAWERLIRSVKTALRSCLINKSLKEDVLMTLLLEAEAIVNSRPLTYIPSSPDVTEAITPFHFILGTSSIVPWTSTLTDSDIMRRCDWRRVLRIADHFWARWLREYLPTLRPRGAANNAPTLGEGDVVLIVDASLPRGLWPLGRVVKVYHGPDGLVRVADVRTRSGTLRRPVRKLVLIEAESQPVTTRC